MHEDIYQYAFVIAFGRNRYYYSNTSLFLNKNLLSKFVKTGNINK
jgi:hypothetical protein